MQALFRRVIDAGARLPITAVLNLPADGAALVQIDRVSYAPPGYHLAGKKDLRPMLSVDPAVNYSSSSVNVLFDSAAAVCGRLPAPWLAGPNPGQPGDMADHGVV